MNFTYIIKNKMYIPLFYPLWHHTREHTHAHTLCDIEKGTVWLQPWFQTGFICACLQQRGMLVAAAQERLCLSGCGCYPVTHPAAPTTSPSLPLPPRAAEAAAATLHEKSWDKVCIQTREAENESTKMFAGSHACFVSHLLHLSAQNNNLLIHPAFINECKNLQPTSNPENVFSLTAIV